LRAFSPFIGKKIQTLLGGLSYGEKCERTLIQKHEHLAFQPIFIIGLPRSGSTLLYQL